LIEDGGWLYPELSDIRRIMAEWGLSEFQDARKADSACARPRQIFGVNEVDRGWCLSAPCVR